MTGRRDQKRTIGMHLLVAVSLLSLLVGVGLSGLIERSYPHGSLAQAASLQGTEGKAAASQGLPDFASLAKKLGPAVVNVSTTQIRKTAQQGSSPFGDDDSLNQFWQRFFGGPVPRGPQRQQGLGSGFIIDRDGTIVTNYHVVDGAEKIVVTLSDGRSFDGKVLGKDQKTDVAVIKISAPQDLPTAPLGDSDRVEVGEWVMAIGNPFGLDHTVTSGIVSAKGRHIGAGPYDDFIQTDASINPGNSGGPLINMRGEVVGINTAIFSGTGGNIGIGFAIPTNLVKELLPQLKDKGKVVRGFVGVAIQKMTPDLADSLGLKQPSGALVADVTKGGPAERAGVKTGDVIVEFNGKEIKDSTDLPLQVARTAPGKTVPVKVLRAGKEMTLSLAVGEVKETKEVVASSSEGNLGLAVQPVTPEIAESLGLDRADGIVITSVKPGSPADDAGLQQGDVIAEVNHRPVRTVSDYERAVTESGKNKTLLFLVRRGEGSMFLALKR
ncbi:MAG TPA: DegQ family serine endoprotease [Methylomirabilota bacterium]|nr:DegQ family serine endoprotease [Methylomirabilota bacterium]